MTFTKTVLGPEVGRGLDLLAGGTEIDQPAYSEGVRLDLPGFTWIMLSGVVALDDDLQVVGAGDLRAQIRFILDTIRRKLEEQGAGITDICRVRVYLVGGLTPERFRIIHEERARIFDPDHYPASTMVEVTSLMKPELLIEIDADAVFSQPDNASNQIETEG
ncbi:MAG: RidA family protein [Actinobacteria bacterium]|nr:RidA family protein [Actinomycetota bacterium]MBU1493583.1 RidA family protein [Actinomycetota bacterium]